MAKAPVAGRAKTRLAREVGVGAATAFARTAARVCLARLARDPRWETIVAVAPDGAVAAFPRPPGVRAVAQGGGDLGARMQRLIDGTAPGPVVIIGTDIPAVRPHHIAAAFRALGQADVAFGPATDGGYWLVAARRRPRCPDLFGNVRWSSPHALADTRANCAGLVVALVDTLEDVDDRASLRRNAGRAGRLVPRRDPITQILRGDC